MSPGDQATLITNAAHAVRKGSLAVFPTDTLYGLSAAVSNAEAVELLRRRARSSERASNDQAAGVKAMTWHAASVSDVRRAVSLPTRVHRRLIAKLLPGPVRFILEQPAGTAERWSRALGVTADRAADVVIRNERLALRVPGNSAARRFLEAVGEPVVAIGVGRDAGRGVLSDNDASFVLDDGPSPDAKASTTVEIDLSGAFRVTSEGRFSEAEVMKALRRTILFVCTGNTCRSPMAEAIAADLIANREIDGISTVVRSAGVAAFGGGPATDEAIRAVAKRGLDLGSHRSRSVTRDMLREAEAVYTMTEDHAHAARAIDPESAWKIERLDPGGDIADPIGGPQAGYLEVADRLEPIIRSRLDELDRCLDDEIATNTRSTPADGEHTL